MTSANAAVNDMCLSCRAIAHFKTCERAGPDNKPFFKGKAVAVEKARCSQILSIDLSPETSDLPSRIRVDLGGCAIWAGELNDVIDIAGGKPLATDSSVYSLGGGFRWGK
jgi:hypothetical protein